MNEKFIKFSGSYLAYTATSIVLLLVLVLEIVLFLILFSDGRVAPLMHLALAFITNSMLRGFITARFIKIKEGDILYKALINVAFLVVNLLWCAIIINGLYKFINLDSSGVIIVSSGIAMLNALIVARIGIREFAKGYAFVLK